MKMQIMFTLFALHLSHIHSRHVPGLGEKICNEPGADLFPLKCTFLIFVLVSNFVSSLL